MRRTKTVTVTFDGRDKGAQYLITEMPASQGEKWATKALLAMLHNGSVDLPEGWQQAPMMIVAGIGILKLLAAVPFSVADELGSELMACITPVALPNLNNQIEKLSLSRSLIEEDIQEITTRAWLKSEVFELHTGFSITGAISKSIASMKDQIFNLTQTSSEVSES
jgi:hypothetical protein